MGNRQDYKEKREAIRKEIYESLSPIEKEAYDATARQREEYERLPSAEKKRRNEINIFNDFASAAGLAIQSPRNEEPPLPDISCQLDGKPYFFELGEITDQGLAKAYSDALKTMEPTGGAFSQELPLVDIIQSKEAASYERNGVPIDLVLFYDKQYPEEYTLGSYLEKHHNKIESLLQNGPFQNLWIFDRWTKRILYKATKTA